MDKLIPHFHDIAMERIQLVVQEEETLATGLSADVVDSIINDLAEEINLMVTDDSRAQDDVLMKSFFTYVYDKTSLNILRNALGRFGRDYDEYHQEIYKKLLQLRGDPDGMYFTEKHMMWTTEIVLQFIGGCFRRRIMQNYESRVLEKVKFIYCN